MAEQSNSVDYHPMPSDHRDDIFLNEDGGTLDGYVMQEGDQLIARIEHVEVDESRRGQGIGRHLVREFARQAVREGAVALSATVLVPELAHIMGKVFGEQNIVRIIGKDGDRGAYFDLSHDEAVRYLKEMSALSDRDMANGVDTSEAHRTAVTMWVPLAGSEVRRCLAG